MKSASIDSLAVRPIQCTSSTTTPSARVVQCGGIDQRGQTPAPRVGSDIRLRRRGVADVPDVVDEQQIVGDSSGNLAPNSCPT